MNKIWQLYMNINLGTQGFSPAFSPVFMGEASPYLSPLFGSLSVHDQNSPDELLDFYLEIQNIDPIEAEIELQISQQFAKNEPAPAEPMIGLKDQSSMVQQTKNELKVPAQIVPSKQSRVYSIIQFLVQNDKQSEMQLLRNGHPLFEGSNNLQYVFRTLLQKFKKLKKTKEEMVKYCMRKAFKFVSDLKKSHKNERSKKQKNLSPQKQLDFEMPFRKNSGEKTMNATFLKQIFSNSRFSQGYSEFLGSISSIIEEDNLSKISYLSETIENVLLTNQTKQIDSIKRLPWTKTILVKTEELARGLIEYASSSSEPSFDRFQQNKNKNE